MPVLIPNVFSDPMEYLQAERLLHRLFDRIKCEDYQGPMWTQWMTNAGNDGTRFYDGSMALYSQVCEERRKGINVWLVDHQDAHSTGETFHALMEPCGEGGEIDSLDISCVLTDENLAKAEELIRLYMVDDRAPEAMTLHIEAMLPDGEGRDRAKRPLALASLDYGLRKHFCVLRGLMGNVLASYDTSPKPGFVFSAAMQFTEEGNDKTVVIEAKAKRDGDEVRLSYELGSRGNAARVKGPTASVSAGCDAPDDTRLVKRWLNAIGQFVEENPDLLP